MKTALQPIIDRFAIGTIGQAEEVNGGWSVATGQGRFILLDGGTELDKARHTEDQRQQAAKTGTSVARVLRQNYQGEPAEYASYAHVGGHYYSLYRLP
ncbi:hypothetical protein ACIPX0_38275 [Streptomyces sp. NPDC090075]|uniref:hypothetical protein n=1 Tax=Streptomyces sp. NPDC090075 TaxID=3365937 RepID=UPI003827167F